MPCSILPGCATCQLSGTDPVCLTCNGTNFVAGPVNGANECWCSSPLYALNNGECLPCSVSIPNCTQCSDNATCTLCENGFYGSACDPCSNIPGCEECIDTTIPPTCTKSAPGYYLDTGNNPVDCSTDYANCGLCDSLLCTAC